MKAATFRGGAHPYDGKELAKDKPIQKLLPTGVEMVYPLSQHIGAPAKPLVKKGDQVLAGQKIAEAGGFVSSPVISSVSGKVKGIEQRRIASGDKVDCIIIEDDKQYTLLPGVGEECDPTTLSREEILGKIKDAGIVGLGGAGFPTHVKLAPANVDEIEYVIINAAECEPYLTSDYRLMLEEPQSLINGLKVILQLFPNAKGYIGIEENKPEAIEILTKLAEKEEKITVCPLQTKYPQGGERFLIDAIAKRQINSTMLPANVGAVVSNVDSTISVYYAVCKNTPLMRRILTVTGDAIAQPANFHVLLGTNYQELVAAAGGFKVEPEKVLSGGPMMGQALFTLDIPVTKNSSSLTCFAKDDVAASPTTACIRCGRCASVCPGRIIPQLAMKAAKKNDLAMFEAYNGMECCECGTCAYVCPAKIPLTQEFRRMRRAVMAERKKAK